MKKFSEHLQELKKYVIQEIHCEEANNGQNQRSHTKFLKKEKKAHGQTDLKKVENLITVDYETTGEITCLK